MRGTNCHVSSLIPNTLHCEYGARHILYLQKYPLHGDLWAGLGHIRFLLPALRRHNPGPTKTVQQSTSRKLAFAPPPHVTRSARQPPPLNVRMQTGSQDEQLTIPAHGHSYNGRGQAVITVYSRPL